MRSPTKVALAAALLAVLLAACGSPPAPARPDPTEVFPRLAGYDYVRVPFEVEADVRAALRSSDLLPAVDDLEVRSVVHGGVPISLIVSVVLAEGREEGDGMRVRDRVARTIAGTLPHLEDRTLGGADVGFGTSGESEVLSWEPHARVVVMVGAHAPGRGILDVAERLIARQGRRPGPLLPFSAPDASSAFAENEILSYVVQPEKESALQGSLQAGPLEPAIDSVSVQEASTPFGHVATVVAMGFEPEYASLPDFPDQLAALVFGARTSVGTVVLTGRPVGVVDFGDAGIALWPDRLGLWVVAIAESATNARAVAEVMIQARTPAPAGLGA